MLHELHPVAICFPEMSGDEYASLLESVRQHGLIHPILLHPDGRILDGRHRDRACRETGTEPKYEMYDGLLDDENLARRIWNENANRRQLTKQQRDLAAGRIANLSRGSSPGTQGGGNVTKGNDGESRDSSSTVSLQRAAEITGTSRESASRAKTVLKVEGKHPGVIKHLEHGHLPTKTAADVVRSGQEDLLDQLDRDDTKEAAEAVARELHERQRVARERAEARRLEKERLDKLVPEPDRKAYHEEMAKKPSERDQSKTSVPLPNITDEEERGFREIQHQGVVSSLANVISGASTTLKRIIDTQLRLELLTDENRLLIAERVRMIQVHLEFLASLSGNSALDDELRNL